MFYHSVLITVSSKYLKRGKINVDTHFLSRGYSQKKMDGVCGLLSKTLTLFMAKICDFSYPFYDQAKNLMPYLLPLWLIELP